MSKKGGYQILDFKRKNLNPDSSTVFDGMFDLITTNHKKPFLVSGVVVDGVEQIACFVNPTFNATDWIFSVYGGILSVSDTNTVIFNKE